LTKHTRDVLPHAKIIWGGIVPTFKPRYAISSVDTLFFGEADFSFAKYIQDPLRKDIEGTWVKNKDGGFIQNKPSNLPQNLDELPRFGMGKMK